jgi:outer membrane protein assembly factor BamB
MELKSGKELWRCDFVEQFKTALPSFGFASSPLVDGGFVYVQAGEALCKLNAESGELVWRSMKGEGGMDSAFSSPIIEEVCGVRQLVVQTRNELCGVSMDDGSVLWNQPIEAFRGMNILTQRIRWASQSVGGQTRRRRQLVSHRPLG